MKILFIGDISGRLGRLTVAQVLPKIKKKHKIDFTIANAENSAHGSGVTENILNELMDAGCDFFTMGDHAFGKTNQFDCYDDFPLIRPANFSQDVPGEGYKVVEINNQKVLIINLIGRVFMKGDHDCPFHKVKEILAMFSKKIKFVIIDIHAETTSEKINMAHYIGDKTTAILGTHTHVMTADAQIMDNGTAYITDVGMTGFRDGSIGVDAENTIKTFLTQIKHPHVFHKKGRTIFNAVLLDISNKTGKAKSIKPITEFINIK